LQNGRKTMRARQGIGMTGSDDSAALFDRAASCRKQGRPHAALRIIDLLLQRHPGMAELWGERGAILMDLGDHAGGLESFRHAIAANPQNATYHNLAGVCLQAMGRPDEALASYDRAIALDPMLAEAHHNRGTIAGEKGQLEEAVANYDRAILARPDFVQALSNKGHALLHLGHPELAIDPLDKAIALEPGLALPRLTKALCHLTLGQYDKGWPLYEARTASPGAVTLPELARPVWRGAESLAGKTLLIHAEQGLGDAIQFCRYAPLLAQRGAQVILSVPAALVRLLDGLHPAVSVIPDTDPFPPSDFHTLLLSLPLALATDAHDIPAGAPYLRAQPERIARWARAIGRDGYRIGIAWQGDPASASDPGRSIPLHHFAGLSNIPGVRLISLQKGPGVEQLHSFAAKIETLGQDFDSGPDAFADTAAAMQNLDLVITCDTAIAHLAGALGRPVWVALKHAPDWRWQLRRPDSPWYPTMRLFRQARRGEWRSVFGEIEAVLVQDLN